MFIFVLQSCSFLGQEAIQTIIYALTTSQLEYCNVLRNIEVQKKVNREYIRILKKILKFRLSNTINVINTWAIPVIRYTDRIVD